MRRSAVIVAVACAVCVAVPRTPSAAAAPAERHASSDQGYADPAGDAESPLAPDLTAVTAFDNANGAVGFRIGYANRACIGAGDSVAVFLDVDRSPATGSPSGGFEYALLLDGSTRAASVTQWNGSAFATSTISVAAGCSSAASPSADTLAVAAARLRIGSTFDFAVESSGSAGAGAQPYHDSAGPWSKQDWPSVLASAGGGRDEPGVVTLAFWFSGQPRWLHLSPTTCTNVQALIDSRVPNSSRALALATVLHETTHAYGVRNEARANCYGVQLVYPLARALAFSAGRAARLEDLALRTTRSSAPPGYWDSARCRSGGAWDLSR